MTKVARVILHFLKSEKSLPHHPPDLLLFFLPQQSTAMLMRLRRPSGEKTHLPLKPAAEITDPQVQPQLHFFFERKLPFLLFAH